jgi:hypothetical protein
MRRDWIWGWIAVLPSLIVAFVAVKSIGFVPGRPWISVGLVLALAMAIWTGMLWMKNRHSIQKIKRSGGEIEFLLRPSDALVEAAILFPLLVGTVILIRLAFNGQIVDWEKDIVVSGFVSFLLSLMNTAYTRSE